MLKIQIESVLSPTIQIRNSNRRNMMESDSLSCYEIGKRYPDFEMIESFIEEYNVDPTKLNIGDIIIRDWQYGHLPNTGYRPYIVVEEFDGVSITVESSFGRRHRICVDPNLMKDKMFHKLFKENLKNLTN